MGDRQSQKIKKALGGGKFSSAHIKYTIGHYTVMHFHSDVNKSAPLLTNATIALALGASAGSVLKSQSAIFQENSEL